jgi:apolipoprotein N-acyltransferase
MRKIATLFLPMLSIFLIAQSALATCTLNGEIIPCDQMPKWPFVFMILFFVFMMLALAFWIWMIVDVAKYEKEETTMWVLIVVLLSFFGAIIYYFVRKRKRGRDITKNADINTKEEKTDDK